MKRTVLLICVIWVVLSTGLLRAQDVTSDLLGRINTLRASLGLPAYTLNSALAAAAQSQAQWMADTSNISHSRPDGSTPRTRAAAAGYGSSWVSENIYMGTIATANDAWNFWLNSAIHYAGMTSQNYKEIGIGSASGAGGRSFVLVFGNPTGSYTAASSSQSSSNSSASTSNGQPSYVVGLDNHGNIMHEIQPDDTLGDIALYYGYTWDNIPYMLELNGLTEADARTLEIGSVFLVPPKAGTYTPTPADTATPTATPEPVTPSPTDVPTETLIPPAVFVAPTVVTPNGSVTPTPTPTITPVIVQTEMIGTLNAPTTAVSQTTTQASANSGISTLLIIGIVLQIGILIVAAIEFFWRART